MHNTSRISLALVLALAVGACGGKDDVATTDTMSSATTVPSTTAPVQTDFRVTELDLGRAVGADNKISDDTDDFKPNDTIYAVVQTEGAASGQMLVARWTFQDGQLVEEQTQAVNNTGTGAALTQFRLNKPSGWPVGKYKVSIMMNGNEVESEEFEVKQ